MGGRNDVEVVVVVMMAVLVMVVMEVAVGMVVMMAVVVVVVAALTNHLLQPNFRPGNSPTYSVTLRPRLDLEVTLWAGWGDLKSLKRSPLPSLLPQPS